MTICFRREPAETNSIPAILMRTACALLLWYVAGSAHAASIYRCIGAHGETTFRDTPCATQARQTKLDVVGQPLIDANSPPPAAPTRVAKPAAGRARGQRASTNAQSRKVASETSWECRAADGEVFYRHARCPGSVPGDGVVRRDYAETAARQPTRGHHDAWGKVSVRGKPISRAEACRRIRAPSAAGRDGAQRDDRVSTYDHLMGRDPCRGG